MNEPKKKEFLVSVQTKFIKRYLVEAVDWERAEDIAIEEAMADTYSAHDPDNDMEVYDVEFI